MVLDRLAFDKLISIVRLCGLLQIGAILNLERLKKIGVNKNIIMPIPKGIRIKKWGIAYFTLEMRDDLVVCQGIDIEKELLSILKYERKSIEKRFSN